MVTLEYAVRHEPIRHAFRFRLLGSLPECERFGLGKDIGDKHVMMAPERIGRVREGDKVARNEPGSLMDQLVERVLSVGPGFAPIDRTRIKGYFLPIESHVFAVALHGQLLQISGKALEILFVWEDSNRLGAEEVVVPNRQKTHQHGQVAFEWGRAEVLIHLMETVEHRPEVVGTNRQHRRESNRG